MDVLNKIINKPAEQLLGLLGDNTIDLTVTSPPYDDLRAYKGYAFPFEQIARELYRVTAIGGVLVWVVGDATIRGSETGTSFKQALFFKRIGFNLHDTMIYVKSNYMPLNHNRYDPSFEYMFVLSKGSPITFNPITVPTKWAGSRINFKGRTAASTTEKKSAYRKRDEDIFVKSTKYHPNVFAYEVGRHKSTKDDIAFQHPATFPERLAEDHILTWTNEGDTVLDCMAGSGTTPKMAILNKRKFIAGDISAEYCDIMEARLLAL